MHHLPEKWITPLTSIRRERALPARGDVLVGPGEQVGPDDVIARCQIPGSIEVVDASRALSLPRDRAAGCVRRAVGEAVQAGEVLASHRGLLGGLRASCTAPAGGQIVAIRDGMILIESVPTTYELRAHIEGQVAAILPDLGAVIVTTAVLIQGIWGCGGEAEGVLKLLVDNPCNPLRGRSIDQDCRGAIVAGGIGLDETALDQAVEAEVRGMIVGSLNADLVPALIKLPFPVMVTEGFGSYPMSGTAFSLLRANAGHKAMLDAEIPVRRAARRPELVIPTRSDEATATEPEGVPELLPGIRVRALRAPYLGAIGMIINLPARAIRLESGARLPVAEVSFDAAEPVLIPLANLEVIR